MIFHWRWYASRTVRQATEFRSQARKILNHQRDLIPEAGVEAVGEAIDKLTIAMKRAPLPEVKQAMESLEKVANKWFRPYPNAGLRENLEVLLVAGAVALAVRTFFFQPMAIPTGSAQPTLWGIEHIDYRGQEDVEMPGRFGRFVDRWIKGKKWVHVVAEEAGEFQYIDPEPKRVFLWIKKQRFRVGSKKYTVWFPPDQMITQDYRKVNRSGLRPGIPFKKGEDILKLCVTSGDHLFVNRLVYNFSKPKRGDTVVFVSYGLDVGTRPLMSNTHYIKRLVAMDGDTVRIGNDRHIIRNGVRLDANTPGFEFVYGEMGEEPREDEYSGHANGRVMAAYDKPGLALNFYTEDVEYTVKENHCLTFGDNTLNSFDSRDWSIVDFPIEKVIGRSSFVFWPITERFGWHRK